MKSINLGKISIPITQFASQGNAVLGIRDSGKSYSATYLGERLYAANIPFVAFDPSGVWKFLRVPGEGKGLPVVVAGGKAPDLPLTPQSAPEIVRAAMRANVSLVIDLYDIHLSKADWSRIVEACVRVLLYENGEHGLRHIFIEEAAEFAPQQIASDKARVYAEIEKLARIGGNALLGYTLINQRAEQVNKAVLELCDCLFLHRQKGKNSLKSLEKWLEFSQGGETKEIIKGLPTLPSGQCWVWPAGAEHATHVKMPQKETFHPDRRALIANPAAANVQRVDATKFVSELRGSLEKYVEEAKANDPAELKKRIRELEKQVAGAGGKTTADLVAAREAGERDGFARGSSHGYKLGWDERAKAVRSALESMSPDLTSIAIDARPENPVRRVQTHRPAEAPQERRTGTALAVTRARQIDGRASSSDLPKGEAAILRALIQFPNGLRREQITVLTTFARSTRDRYLQYLKQKGLVDQSGEVVTATDAGRDALPDAEPLPTGAELRDHWLRELPSGEKRILEVLIEDFPKAVSREDLSERTGFARSTRDRYLQYMANKQVIQATRGEVRASEDLF